VARYDLIVAGLIGLAILALGQAIVAYEVFTGKTLPRRGLRRYWRNAIILGIGYGVAVGLSQLLAALLMTLFYALLSWRSYAECERYIEQLRPFVASQRLYEQLVTAPTPAAAAAESRSDVAWVDATMPFHALCEDVLGARVAYLVALGPLAPLVGPPVAYPDGRPLSLPALAEITAQFRSPETICVPLDPSHQQSVQPEAAHHSGASWAVPLWSERGLIGVLLLGEKRDGGLYTQEEIEIARASGERLIDTQASAEMARRLMALQRQRLAESQVLDRQTRRVLHDDVLPRLHTAMLSLNNGSHDAITTLADIHRQLSDLLHEMPTFTAPEVARLGPVGALRRAIADELGSAFDQVTWQVEPEADRKAQKIPSLTAEVLYYAAREAVRNAACHGRDTDGARSLLLDVSVAWHDGLQILIEDNGVGLDATRPSGSRGGQGLALHSTMMAVVGGSLTVESEPGAYTRVTLNLPTSSIQLPAVGSPTQTDC
jgi:signal transduction histidine kinase